MRYELQTYFRSSPVNDAYTQQPCPKAKMPNKLNNSPIIQKVGKVSCVLSN